MKPIRLVFLLLFFTFCGCEDILFEKNISNETVILTAPFDSAQFTSTSITFSWNSVEGANQYKIQIARPNFENPLEIVVDETISETFSTQQLNIGTYQWRVSALNDSYQTSYTTRTIHVTSNDDFQDNNVNLLSPVQQFITNTPLQTLSWQPVLDAVSYQIQIENASNAIILDQSIVGTSFNYTFAEGVYQWRVRASNGVLSTLYSTRTIQIDTTIPNTPQLSMPQNNSILTTQEVTFAWTRTPISGSNEVDVVKIFSDSNLTNLVEEAETSSPFNTTLDNGVYYWVVIAKDAAGNISTQSSTFSFTIN